MKRDIEGGTLEVRDCKVIAHWDTNGTETWTYPTTSKAREGFERLYDRWRTSEMEQDLKTRARRES